MFFYKRVVIILVSVCCAPFLFAEEAQDSSDEYWANLTSLCGSRYEGEMVFPTDSNDDFKGKLLVAEFAQCTDNEIRIPFAVGENRSRTWVITRVAGSLQLKHDHRHEDGSVDDESNYGGLAGSAGSALSQSFAADKFTQILIPAASTNVWAISLSADFMQLTYHLERHSKPRFTAVLNKVEREHYEQGSEVSELASLYDQSGQKVNFRALLAESAKPVNVVFLFGGGAMGFDKARKTGGLWCPDSYEDSHIVRSLAKQYKGKVGFFPVAIPPVFHSKHMGFSERVFLDQAVKDVDFTKARKSFIESTQAAVERGVIPVQPYYDLDFDLLISEKAINERASDDYEQSWHGTFRAADESQRYGVPNIWLVDNEGRVLAQPFRGNVYQPHGGDFEINYTLKDVSEAIKKHLE